MKVMITGGGTGGHTSPAVAVIEELRKRDPRLAAQWVGCRGSIEERVSATYDIPFRSVPVEGWPRSGRLRKVWALGKLSIGMLKAFLQLRSFRPDAVIGVGGYVSVPLVWMAQRLKIPTILHEQNKQLGLANRILAPRADRLLLSYADTVGTFRPDRTKIVGNPVRGGFVQPPSRDEARAALSLDPEIPVVLVSGGSQGAQTLNRAIGEALPSLEAGELQLIWMTGKKDVTAAREAVQDASARVDVHGFIDDMVTACAAADLIVGRAGASSTAELAVIGRPSILVPYPFATDNHQEKNARAFEDAGAALVLLDDECTTERLLAAIRDLVRDPVRLAKMREAAFAMAQPAAAETIVEEVFELVFEDAKPA